MKILIWIGVALLTLSLGFGLVQTLASERVEVVELETRNEQGEHVITRLWIMDYEGYQYLRVGADGSGWFSRLVANDTVQVTRGDVTKRYRTVQRPDLDKPINELMQAKYTWGDTFFATVFGSREGSIPIELHELED